MSTCTCFQVWGAVTPAPPCPFHGRPMQEQRWPVARSSSTFTVEISTPEPTPPTSELRTDAWRAVKAVGQGHLDFWRALTTSVMCGRQLLDGWRKR